MITDHLGTPTALVDSAKRIRWQAKYYPFGQTYSEYVSAANDIRFPGQLRDDETGLYYNWHRYYGPGLGRYYQADRIRSAREMDLHEYSSDNLTQCGNLTGLVTNQELMTRR